MVIFYHQKALITVKKHCIFVNNTKNKYSPLVQLYRIRQNIVLRFNRRKRSEATDNVRHVLDIFSKTAIIPPKAKPAQIMALFTVFF